MTLDVARLAEAHRADGLGWYNPTPPQRRWHEDTATVKLLRGGNQIGKTRAGMAEVIWRCLGTHPYQETHRPPIEAWIICHSWEQSIAVQAKAHELMPLAELHGDTQFVPGKGYRGKTPIVRFRNGSLLRFKTTNQGSLGLASATVHYVGIDEPPPPEIWSELAARVLRYRGVIGLTLTPVGRPVDWLRELCDEGRISDHQVELTEANCTPAGETPFVGQASIDRVAQSYLPWERAQRIEGAWQGIAVDRVFGAFGDEMVADVRPVGRCWIAVGIDHGSVAGAQIAVLAAVALTEDYTPRIWVLDEAVSDGSTTPEQDAIAICEMLARNRLAWSQVDLWVGDRKHGGRAWGGAKSNRLLEEAFSRVLKLGVGKRAFGIETAHKPRGSVWEGVRILHATMQRGDFWISPRCEQVADSLRYWQGADDDYKHAVDALRYGAVTVLKRQGRGPSRVRLY